MDLGVFLFIVALFYFSLILLADFIIQHLSVLDENGNTKYQKTLDMLQKIQSPSVKQTSGYVAFLISLWNFFAPDFGSIYGGLTLIGALVPSTILFLDSFILCPNLRELLPLPQKAQEKIDLVINKIYPVAGWLTLSAAIVHAIAFKVPFL